MWQKPSLKSEVSKKVATLSWSWASQQTALAGPAGSYYGCNGRNITETGFLFSAPPLPLSPSLPPHTLPPPTWRSCDPQLDKIKEFSVSRSEILLANRHLSQRDKICFSQSKQGSCRQRLSVWLDIEVHSSPSQYLDYHYRNITRIWIHGHEVLYSYDP